MGKGKFLIFSLIGAVVCSALCIGYATNKNSVTTLNYEETVEMVPNTIIENFNPDDYWSKTPIEEIRSSMLTYIDEMIKLTNTKLEDFIKENNESKIKLYENEIKRLNKILNNVNLAKNKEELRRAMEVRHKDNI